jgi:hypothetical protein
LSSMSLSLALASSLAARAASAAAVSASCRGVYGAGGGCACTFRGQFRGRGWRWGCVSVWGPGAGQCGWRRPARVCGLLGARSLRFHIVHGCGLRACCVRL